MLLRRKYLIQPLRASSIIDNSRKKGLFINVLGVLRQKPTFLYYLFFPCSMDIKFFAAKFAEKVVLPEKLIEELPERICLFTTIQFFDSLGAVKQQLETSGKKVLLRESMNYYYDGKTTRPGQLLGCNLENFKEIDAFLYVGDGLFHPQILMVKNDYPVFSYDPINQQWEKLDNKPIELAKKRRRAALSKFLMSNNIGVILSTKPGQNLYNKALLLKQKYPDKKFYFVAFNDVDFGRLENFPFVECWVNTACYRIGVDELDKTSKPIVNINDL